MRSTIHRAPIMVARSTVRDLQHLGKPFADMQGHHLQTNDFQDKLRTNHDKKIHGAGL